GPQPDDRAAGQIRGRAGGPGNPGRGAQRGRRRHRRDVRAVSDAARADRPHPPRPRRHPPRLRILRPRPAHAPAPLVLTPFAIKGKPPLRERCPPLVLGPNHVSNLSPCPVNHLYAVIYILSISLNIIEGASW